MNKWDVVLLRYPFSDLTTIKVRPALVISPDSYNSGEDAVFIAITSNVARAGTYDVPILSNHSQFSIAGLHYDSIIRVTKIFTLKQTLVAKKLGTLGPDFQAEVSFQLRAFLELEQIADQTDSSSSTV
jgi:mRNA interferase MazF